MTGDGDRDGDASPQGEREVPPALGHDHPDHPHPSLPAPDTPAQPDQPGRPDRADRPGLDVDAAFAAIVAEFGRPTVRGGPWPAAEDVPDEPAGPVGPPGAPAGRAGDDGPVGRRPGVPPAPPGASPGSRPGTLPGAPLDAARRAPRRGPRHRLPEAGGPDDRTLGERGGYPREPVDPLDDVERFVPPEAPPITSTDLVSRLAWLGVVGGPLLLLVAALVSHTLPTLVVLGALAAFVGGFVTLVARLPRDRGDDDGNDGAIV